MQLTDYTFKLLVKRRNDDVFYLQHVYKYYFEQSFRALVIIQKFEYNQQNIIYKNPKKKKYQKAHTFYA